MSRYVSLMIFCFCINFAIPIAHVIDPFGGSNAQSSINAVSIAQNVQCATTTVTTTVAGNAYPQLSTNCAPKLSNSNSGVNSQQLIFGDFFTGLTQILFFVEGILFAYPIMIQAGFPSLLAVSIQAGLWINMSLFIVLIISGRYPE